LSTRSDKLVLFLSPSLSLLSLPSSLSLSLPRAIHSISSSSLTLKIEAKCQAENGLTVVFVVVVAAVAAASGVVATLLAGQACEFCFRCNFQSKKRHCKLSQGYRIVLLINSKLAY